MPPEEPVHGVKSYPDVVDVRFIVMTFDRKDSVMKCLQSLQGIELDGDKGAIDVFIDRGPKGTDNATLQALSGFRWNHGPVHVHPQITHVGMVGQWVDSWRAQPNSSEIAIILEDDIDLSRYAYRWLKAAYRQYGHLPHVGGFSLNEGTIPGMKSLPSDLAFLHAIIGTYAFAPIARHWNAFQHWYHERQRDPTFRPYVDASPVTNGWYRGFEKTGLQHNMWEAWYIRYCYDNGLFTVYTNLQQHDNVHEFNQIPSQTYLAYHRQEKGSHFSGGNARSSKNSLIKTWHESFLNFPQKLKKYYFDSKEIEVINKH